MVLPPKFCAQWLNRATPFAYCVEVFQYSEKICRELCRLGGDRVC